MLAIGHVAVGFSLGLLAAQTIGNPGLALAVGFSGGLASHYLTDLIPHGHITAGSDSPYDSFLIFLDLILGGAVFLLLGFVMFGLTLKFLTITLGMAGSILPDFFEAGRRYGLYPHTGVFRLEMDFHHWTHWHGSGKRTLPIRIYDLWQVLVVSTVFIYGVLHIRA